MFRRIGEVILIAVLGSVALAHVPELIEKIQGTGQVTSAVVNEAGNVANAGVSSLQKVGGPPTTTPTTDTTAPPVGSGR